MASVDDLRNAIDKENSKSRDFVEKKHRFLNVLESAIKPVEHYNSPSGIYRRIDVGRIENPTKRHSCSADRYLCFLEEVHRKKPDLPSFGEMTLLHGDEKVHDAVDRLAILIETENRLVGADSLTQSKRTGRTVDNVTHTVASTSTSVSNVDLGVSELNKKVDVLMKADQLQNGFGSGVHLSNQSPHQREEPSRHLKSMLFISDNYPSTRPFHQVLHDLAFQISEDDPYYVKHIMATCMSQDDISPLERIWRTLFVNIFVKEASVKSNIYLVFDVVDESMINIMKDINQVHLSSRVQIVMLGRPQPTDPISEALEMDVPTILVVEDKNSADIILAISSRVLRAVSPELRTEIAPRRLNEMLNHILESFSSTFVSEEAENLNELLARVTCSRRLLMPTEPGVVLRPTRKDALMTTDRSSKIVPVNADSNDESEEKHEEFF
ncbi:hypothetical protein PAAG_12532 [Paracoccidioides lutzii Pb01]|uniref:Nephrocystin 3-like N-terminal domain-containing protein n=1 Tax=Paracoccidioides lutzii (strain ATCC MYA-826 / Pb01) TaxID=502779 RepID=A0A0A2VIQ5_PARBA|nr:hypothetical protein PAAG_12532 [Paracoccidioides lutzii Pb01]KGQ00804.1 hypothetical protein PAAG_12532 [Paracoccidioides lutzii Pb01]